MHTGAFHRAVNGRRLPRCVILGLIQVGGFGIMTFASFLGLLVSRRLGLKSRLAAAAETEATGLGDVRTVGVGVVTISVIFELFTAVLLTLRIALGYGARRAVLAGCIRILRLDQRDGWARRARFGT